MKQKATKSIGNVTVTEDYIKNLIRNQLDDWKKEVILNGQRSKLNDTVQKRHSYNEALVIVMSVNHVLAE